MTVPPGERGPIRKVSEMVMGMFPKMRYGTTKEEDALAIHIRGNPSLYEALTGLIRSRIEGRASVPEPSDPMLCKSMVARDRELQWLLLRLEFVYNLPTRREQEGEQPAA